MKAIIIDDEENNISYLRKLLQKYDYVEVIGTASNVKESIKLLNDLKPDVVFLDIILHNNLAFEILETLREIDFEIIFTTAFSEYAIKAFKFSAFDYLLKPIDQDELNTAINKLNNQINKFNEIKISLLEESLYSSRKQRKMAISLFDGLTVIEIDSVIYVEADGAYSRIFIKDKQPLLCSKSIKYFEELLGDYDYYRVHKSYLVNLNEIVKYQRSNGGSLLLSNGMSIDVSEKKKETLLTYLYSKFVNIRK